MDDRDPIMQFFVLSDSMSDMARSYAKQFNSLALYIHDTTSGTQERTVALRKLLEARDAALRARAAIEGVK